MKPLKGKTTNFTHVCLQVLGSCAAYVENKVVNKEVREKAPEEAS